MSQFIDKRPNNRHKSAVNRQRFLRRFRNQIKQSVSNAILERSITDIENGEKISLPAKDILEPDFRHGVGGRNTLVLPGNKDFVVGDTLKRPPKDGRAQGFRASNQGEGMDDFVFQISEEEFLKLFFEDLELPNLVKTQLAEMTTTKMVRAGFTAEGIPANINIIRSLKGAMSRRLVISGHSKKRLTALEEELRLLLLTHSSDDPSVIEVKRKIERIHNRLSHIHFIDPFDLRYHHRVKQSRPTTQAVMFCLMDVSGSMDEAKKDIAKRFFILLYLFLTKSYETIKLVFIRHHTSAKEVDEHEFFYSRETGGTVVSSALELMSTIIQERYPTGDWNIYGAQASDGDNWNNDSPHCQELLANKIMPYVQYFAYVEIMPRHHQSLWEMYQAVKETNPHFAMQHIIESKDIYPVFRNLFKRHHSLHSKPAESL